MNSSRLPAQKWRSVLLIKTEKTKLKPLRAILIDDESSSRSSLRQKIGTHCPDIEIIAECEGGEDGLEAIEEKKPDVVFLDVEMPRMNGFTMLQNLKNRSFELIFTTAYDHYAIKAIRYSALDYLVKPVEVEELKESVKKAKEKREQNIQAGRGKKLFNSVVILNTLKNIASQFGIKKSNR